MGKLLNYIIMIVMIDVLFLVTGQLGANSPTSLILGAIQGLTEIKGTQLWLTLIGVAGGAVGITALLVVGTVRVGLVTTFLQALIFIPIALALIAMIGDFSTVFLKLADFNVVLATVIMAPIMIIFVFVVVEWVRNRD